MSNQHDNLSRTNLPIPDRTRTGLITYDAKDPDTKFPPIEGKEMYFRYFRLIRRKLVLHVLLATLMFVPAASFVQEPLVFGVIGDSGLVTPGLLGVIREMKNYRNQRAKFDFVLMLGDNVYQDGIGPGLQKVFEEPFADLLKAGVEFYAALGNHDIRRGTDLQLNYPKWNMKGRHFYSFTKGDGLVEFFALDSTALSGEAKSLVMLEKARLDRQKAELERNGVTDQEKRELAKINAELGEDVEFINQQEAIDNEQLVWLNDALSASKARWKVVFLHHSIYSAATKFGGHGRQRSLLRLRSLLEPIFVNRGVDLVLAGHDHHYDRSTLQPTASPNRHRVQYVTAGASALLRVGVVSQKNTFTAKAVAGVNSFLVVRATTDAIQIEAIGGDGKTLDTFAVVKSTGKAKAAGAQTP